MLSLSTILPLLFPTILPPSFFSPFPFFYLPSLTPSLPHFFPKSSSFPALSLFFPLSFSLFFSIPLPCVAFPYFPPPFLLILYPFLGLSWSRPLCTFSSLSLPLELITSPRFLSLTCFSPPSSLSPQSPSPSLRQSLCSSPWQLSRDSEDKIALASTNCRKWH